MRAQLRGAGVLLVALWLLVGSCPGLDVLTPERAQRFPGGPALLALDEATRRPLEAAWKPLERPARIAQTWSLYTDGAASVRRMEVYVDGELKHRSADPQCDWASAELRTRRVRAMVSRTCKSEQSRNARGVVGFVVRLAQRDFPEATEVRIECREGSFPDGEAQLVGGYLARAPGWELAWW